MDRSNGAGWAWAGDKSPGATPDINGNAEAARKSLRFTKHLADWQRPLGNAGHVRRFLAPEQNCWFFPISKIRSRAGLRSQRFPYPRDHLDLETDPKKRELFDRLAPHLAILA